MKDFTFRRKETYTSRTINFLNGPTYDWGTVKDSVVGEVL